MSLTADQIDDLVLLTMDGLIKRGAFVNMSTDLTEFVTVQEVWNKRKKVLEGGQKWRFEYMMDHNHSTKAIGLYEQDSSNFGDVMASGEVEMRFINSNYVYDVLEQALQGSATTIVDYVETKYQGMMASFYESMEAYLWGKPATSADKKTPWGVAYWVVRNASTGFNGGNPTGFSEGRAGIDSTVYPRFKNYTGTYAAVTKDDLIKTMRTAARKTAFRSPLSHSVPDLANMGNGIYTNIDVVEAVENILDTQNMNLGTDVAGMSDRGMFKSTPFTYVPYLDADTTDPVYMLDWRKMAVGVLSGWEKKISAPQVVAGAHNVRRVDMDVSMNMCCTDPRFQTVLYKA